MLLQLTEGKKRIKYRQTKVAMYKKVNRTDVFSCNFLFSRLTKRFILFSVLFLDYRFILFLYIYIILLFNMFNYDQEDGNQNIVFLILPI